MANIIDYHVHTDNSYDCKMPMADMCKEAIARGVSEIAYTDHFNNHLLDIDLGCYDPEQYFVDIAHCRKKFPKLTIRAAVEVGEPHRWQSKVRPVLERYPYDLVLGSLHWVGNHSMFDPNYFRARTPEQAFGDYFAELLMLVEHGGFDILAHVDLPKRIGFGIYGDFDICAYEKSIRLVWQACLDNHIIPEINTKGIRYSVKQFHPSSEALVWYAEMGGQGITLGSDAHHTQNIADEFALATRVAREAGLTYIYQFEGRQIVGKQPL